MGAAGEAGEQPGAGLLHWAREVPCASVWGAGRARHGTMCTRVRRRKAVDVMVSSVLCVAIRRTAAGRYFLRTAAAADRCGTRYGFLSCGRVRECRHLESSSVVKVFAIPFGAGDEEGRGKVLSHQTHVSVSVSPDSAHVSASRPSILWI